MDVSTILKRIELRRIELGMSKTEFYEKSGISSATYSQWNTNTFQPSRRKLMAAASALKMTYEELVGQETTIEQKEIPPTKKVDGMEEELIQIYSLQKNIYFQYFYVFDIIFDIPSLNFDTDLES